MANFFKELLSNRFNVNGAPVPWVPLSGNAGYLTVPDGSPLDIELSKLVGKLGVSKISDAELEEKKTTRKYVEPKLNRFGKSSVKPIPQIKARKDDLFKPVDKAEAAPAAAPAKPEAPPIPAPSTPKLGKLKPAP